MHKLILAVPALALVAGCAQLQGAATQVGVSPEVQTACAAAVAEEIPGISEDMDFDALMDRARAKGMACLIAAAQDVLTARLVAAPAAAPDVFAPAGDTVAAAAIVE
jgi:hypothetical protein